MIVRMVSLDPQKKFLLIFALVLVGSFAVIAADPVNDAVIVPFTELLTRISASTLNVIGQDVVVSSTVMGNDDFLVDVKNGCNGVEAMLILLAAVTAFPANWKQKLLGLLLGGALIQIVNLIRIDSLYLLGRYFPEVFDLFHTAVWQILVVLVAVGFFLYWSRSVRTGREVAASGAGA